MIQVFVGIHIHISVRYILYFTIFSIILQKILSKIFHIPLDICKTILLAMRDILQTDLIRIKLYTFHVSVSIMMVRKDLVKLLPCFFCKPTLRMCACPNDDKIGNLLIYNMFIIKCIPNKFDVFIKCRNREYIGNNNRQHNK